jgi:hypothetical protein
MNDNQKVLLTTFNKAVGMSDCMTLNSRIVGEWLGKNAEAVIAYLKYYSGILLEGLRKTMKPSLKLTGLKTEIWNQDFLKRQQDSQPFDQNFQ